MAGGTGSGGKLEVSRCVRETARERYRMPKSAVIPFENLAPMVFVEADEDEGEGVDEEQTGVTATVGPTDNIPNPNPMDVDENNDGNNNAPGQLVEAPGIALGATNVLENFDFDAFLNGEDAATDAFHDGATEIDIVAIATALGVTPANLGEPPAGEVGFADFMAVGDVVIVDGESDDLNDEEGLESVSTQSEPDGPDAPEGLRRVPAIARWRLNLTALSQVHNLYFVAFRNQIHISRPRSCVSHQLPPTPDLVLTPVASRMSLLVGGFLDRHFPHQINHLIVGDFGHEEILLLAYDDGDVIGYFTKHIEDEILRREEWPPVAPRTLSPCFHSNVGKSAWGLAIHKKSRLIAVGSNSHVATVFVPALTGHPYSHIPGVHSGFYRTYVKDHRGVPRPMVGMREDNTVDGIAIEDLMRRRDANWKIILETGPAGDNIPNLAFASDEDGNAEKIVAVDVAGNTWLMHIWTLFEPNERILGLHRAQAVTMPEDTGKPKGWGVLVLQESSFLPTKDFEDSLGLSKKESRHASNAAVGQWIDISQGIKNIPGNAIQQSWLRGRRSQQDVLSELGQLLESEYWFEAYSSAHPPLRWPLALSVPRVVSRPSWESKSSSEGFSDSPSGHCGLMKPSLVLGDGSSILRTYETDIELRSHLEGGVGIMCQHATRQLGDHLRDRGRVRWAHERLCNNIYVPELSLVVIGSMSGRVALVTLTRPRKHQLDFERGFKIEAILPAEKEEDKGWRPICALLGVAVGPLPFAGKPEKVRSATPAKPRRYRLMLQYYDLDILSYEISRDSTTDNLSIL